MFMQNQAAFVADTTQADIIDLEALMFPATLNRSGILEGTRVETSGGWRPIESLVPGDAVFTLDGGLRQITALHREQILPARTLVVPGGALDNCAEMRLLPGQHMLLQNDRAEAAFGNPLALIPAAAMAGYHGIQWVNSSGLEVDVLTLEFDEEEVVYGNTGALFHCPEARQIGAARLVSKFFSVLNLAQGRAMVELMKRDEKEQADLLMA